MVIGTSMYQTTYRMNNGQLVDQVYKRKIGGGWYRNGPRFFEESWYSTSPTGNTYMLYGENLERWSVNAGLWGGGPVNLFGE